MALSTLGFVRCYVSPRLGGAHAHTTVRAAHQRLYRRSRFTGDRSSNDVVGPKTSGAGAVEQDSHEDEWDTWEFGTWKVCDVSRLYNSSSPDILQVRRVVCWLW